MNHRLFFIFTIVSSLITNICFAQLQATRLNVGDHCKDFELSTLNYPSETIKIPDFNGKAILLDFWATWCAPCVASFPEMDVLQKKFAKDLIIIPVTDEDRETVKNFFDKLYKVKKITPFSVINDRKLNEAFPHNTVPHYVWIDKNGMIKAITYPELVNETNLKSLVAGAPLNFPIKELPLPADGSNGRSSHVSLSSILDANHPLSDVLGNDSNMVSYHLLTRYIPQFPGGGSWSQPNCINMSNSSILALFQIAYGEGMKFFGGFNKIRLITKDSLQFTDDAGEGRKNTQYRVVWRSLPNHLYNYVLKVPTNDSAQRWNVMRMDLAENFPFIRAKIEKENKECLVLKTIAGSNSFKSKNNGKSVMKRSPYFINCNNTPIDGFIAALEMAFQKSNYGQVINETGYTGKVDLAIEADLSDLNAINRALANVGLILEKEQKVVDILVIRDLRSKDGSLM